MRNSALLYGSISGLMHLGLALAFLGTRNPGHGDVNLRDLTKPKKMEIRTLSPAEFNRTFLKTQIVSTDDQLKTPETPSLVAEGQKIFLSKHNQSVDQNTRASRVGSFKNNLKISTQRTTLPHQSNAKNKSDAQPSIDSKNFFKLARNPKDLEQESALTSKTGRLSIPQRSPAAEATNADSAEVSQTDDHLEDVAVGAQTLLNTREFVFYSFYDRLKTQISDTWNARLSQELDLLMASSETLQIDRRTQVEVSLDSKGQLLGVRVLKSSGLNELDRAAVSAFHDASPFPNPPRALLGEQKDIKVKWDFVVVAEVDKPVRVQLRRAPGF